MKNPLRWLWKPIAFTILVLIIVAGIGSLRNNGLRAFLDGASALFGLGELSKVTVDVKEETGIPIFEIASLDIFANNMSLVEIKPGGFLNPGDVVMVVEYDSFVKLGIRDPASIRMSRNDNVLYIDTASIIVEALEARVTNYRLVRYFRSNPFLVMTPEVTDAMFEAQREHEAIAAEKAVREQNMTFAKSNFMSNYEHLCNAMGLTVVWVDEWETARPAETVF